MTCAATPSILWPPNGKWVSVRTTVEAADEVSGPASFVLMSVADSEGREADGIRGFVLGQPDTEGWMRARRFRSARVYTLTYTSMDEVGNIGGCDAVVAVPHDQRK